MYSPGKGGGITEEHLYEQHHSVRATLQGMAGERGDLLKTKSAGSESQAPQNSSCEQNKWVLKIFFF